MYLRHASKCCSSLSRVQIPVCYGQCPECGVSGTWYKRGLGPGVRPGSPADRLLRAGTHNALSYKAVLLQILQLQRFPLQNLLGNPRRVQLSVYQPVYAITLGPTANQFIVLFTLIRTLSVNTISILTRLAGTIDPNYHTNMHEHVPQENMHEHVPHENNRCRYLSLSNHLSCG